MRAVLGAWGVSLVVVCAYLLGGHLLTLPTPETDNPLLTEAIRIRRRQVDQWFALHVLYGDCGCSRRVFRHLSRRGPSSLAEEKVLLVGPHTGDVAELEEAGFSVEVTTSETLDEHFDISAAPLLALTHPSGTLRYVGGYTDRKRGPEIEDIDLIRAVRAGRQPPALPLFGCAVNTRLARQVDPLGLR